MNAYKRASRLKGAFLELLNEGMDIDAAENQPSGFDNTTKPFAKEAARKEFARKQMKKDKKEKKQRDKDAQDKKIQEMSDKLAAMEHAQAEKLTEKSSASVEFKKIQ